MGPEQLQSEAIESKDETALASYDIISFYGPELPENYSGLVYSRWLRSLRYGNFLFKMIDSKVYYEKYAAYVGQILAKPECKVRLAVLSDDQDVALGFCVNRGDILDYVHVHHSARSMKIGTRLTPEKIKCLTHWTYQGERFATKKYGRWIFNPYA